MKALNKLLSLIIIFLLAFLYACKDDESNSISSSIKVDEFSPIEALIGAEITIKGSGFSESTTVWFNETKATEIISVDNNTIVVRVPVGAATGRIGVLNGDEFAFFDNNFTVIPSAVITGYTPSSAKPGETVLISGTDFHEIGSENISVIFSGEVVATPLEVTANSINVVVPRNAQTGPVSISFNNMETISGPAFEVLLPSIVGYTADMVSRGDAVGINVSNFPNVTINDIEVLFNGDDGSPVKVEITSYENGTIYVTVPDNAVTGVITINVDGYTLVGGELVISPEITGFEPESAKVNTQITIKGTNFPLSGEVDVYFAAVNGGHVKATGTFTDNGLEVYVPEGMVTGKIYFMMNDNKIESSVNFEVIESFSYSFTCKDVAKKDDSNYAISENVNPCDYDNAEGNGTALGEWKKGYRGTDEDAKGMVIWDAKPGDYIIFKVKVPQDGDYIVSFDAKLATSTGDCDLNIAADTSLSDFNNSQEVNEGKTVTVKSGGNTNVSKVTYQEYETSTIHLSDGDNYVRILFSASATKAPILRKVRIFN